MKNIKKVSLILCSVALLSSCLHTTVATAGTSGEGKGHVQFSGKYKQEIVDPEHPDVVVDPGETPQTNGELRIDFVPKLNFWRNAISIKDTQAFANAQLFHGDSVGARGNFIQVSDYRGTAGGWQLQVKQETQFQNATTKNKELKGAVISFDQSWANSTRDAKEAPAISKDVIRIDNIGATYNLAEATKGTGEGKWSISFGASIDNPLAVKDTLSPRLDPEKNPYVDQSYNNQPIFSNSAISLSIPGKTKIDPVPYQTVLTWTLSELP